MGKVDLQLLQTEFDLLQLVKFLETFDTWTKSIKTDYVSLSNAMLMRKHLYEICTTISTSDHKDVKQKRFVSCTHEYLA